MTPQTTEIDALELWKDVVGYEGLYTISNMGRVRSQYGKDKYLGITKSGYYVAVLMKNNKKKTYRVHRLVAAAFIGEQPNDKPDVNHINEIKTDNRVENLEWANRRENNTHSKRKGLVGCCKPKGGRRWLASIGIDKTYYRLGLYDTELEAHQAYMRVLKFMGLENKYARS